MNIYLYEYKENILVYIEGGSLPSEAGWRRGSALGP